MIVRRAAPWACALALAGAGALTAYATAEPVPGGQATIYVTVRVPVQRLYRSHSAGFWHLRNVQANVRLARAHNTIRVRTARLRRAERASRRLARDYRDDFGIAGSPFLCVHRGEGSWTAATGNGYYGGLQLDLDFQRTYGGPFLRAWGTADHWPPYVQIAVAEAARLSGRGYHPWPRTARACGLIR